MAKIVQGEKDQTGNRTTLGRDGRVPKRGYLRPDPIHPGMTENQSSGFLRGGMGAPYAGAPDGSSSNPLDPTVPGKNFVGKSVPAIPGHL